MKNKILIAVLLTASVLTSFKLGMKFQTKKDSEEMNYLSDAAATAVDRAMTHPDFKAGFDQCQEQF